MSQPLRSDVKTSAAQLLRSDVKAVASLNEPSKVVTRHVKA